MEAVRANRRIITRQYFRLLPLQILLAAVGAVNTIVDSLFASNAVGGGAMSVITLYGPVLTFLNAISGVFVGGSQVLCGKYMGRNQLDHSQNVFTLDMLLVGAFAAAVTAIHVFGSFFGIGRLFSADPELSHQMDRYILGLGVGVVPSLLSVQLAAFLSLENKTRRAAVASVALIVVNFAAHYLFTVVFRMGTLGLALSTSVASWVFFAIQAQHFLSGESMMKLKLKGIRLRESFDIVRTGYPGALSTGYQTVRGVIINRIITIGVGVAGLSAFGAVNSFLSLFWSVPVGMTAVARMLISLSVGEEDRQTLTDVMRVMFSRCLPLMFAMSTILVLCAGPFTNMYYHNPADPVYQMTLWGFRIMPMCMPLTIICLYFMCYGQVTGKRVLVQILSLLDGLVCVAGFSALLVPLISMNGVYVANVLNSVVTAVTCCVYAWVRNRRFPRTMDELMTIPDDFGVGPEDRLDLSVRSMEEVVTVSQRVRAFLARANVDRGRTFKAGLCLEEMAGNVVDHGFNKDRRRHSVDIRVVHKGDELILRIKDDCVPFDPKTRTSILVPEDATKNIGIRMVYDIATSVNYQNILGLNVLTIRI